MTSGFLHVANGTSTTMTIEAAGMSGATSIWADPLHDGPVPDVTDEELLDVRARFLAGDPAEGPAEAGDSVIEVADDLKEWRRVIREHDGYDELVLWFEHDLFDQLNLIQLLTFIRTAVPADKTVSLICIDSFPGRPSFKGLGELTAAELAPLLDTRQRVTDAQYAVAERAWHVFRQPTPEALDSFRREESQALPFLAPALARFLQEYPWTLDGLSRRERRLLQLAQEGPTSLARAFPRMDDGDRTYYIADTSLSDTADGLASTSPPLLTVSAGEGLQRTVAITDTGRAVLTGEIDRVATCGIDRWLGGVHVSTDDLWRWHDERQELRPG
jgi:hypothetical protein